MCLPDPEPDPDPDPGPDIGEGSKAVTTPEKYREYFGHQI